MKRVLFIDTQNSIVGPMAEAWFNRHADGCGVASSCGVLPVDWINAPTVQAMYEAGIDIGHKLPRGLDERKLAQADVIVLIGVWIHLTNNVQTIKWDITDPAQPSLADVRILRGKICQRVDQLIQELQQEHEPGFSHEQWQTAIVNLLCM